MPATPVFSGEITLLCRTSAKNGYYPAGSAERLRLQCGANTPVQDGFVGNGACQASCVTIGQAACRLSGLPAPVAPHS